MSKTFRHSGLGHRATSKLAQMRDRVERVDIEMERRETDAPLPNRVGQNRFKSSKVANTTRLRSTSYTYADGCVGLCDVCGKTSFLNRKQARRAARRILPGEQFSYYRCGPVFHYGHLPRAVVGGAAPRPEPFVATQQRFVVRPRLPQSLVPSPQEASA